jgi:ferredoxin
VLGRGRSARVAMAGAARWADGRACTDCGRCVAGCPTGALHDDRPRGA